MPTTWPRDAKVAGALIVGFVASLAALAVSRTPPLTDESEGANIGGGFVLLFSMWLYCATLVLLVFALALGQLSWRSAVWTVVVAVAIGLVFVGVWL